MVFHTVSSSINSIAAQHFEFKQRRSGVADLPGLSSTLRRSADQSTCDQGPAFVQHLDNA